MSELVCFDDLKVGDRWVSDSRLVTEEDVAKFAELTGDFDRLHTDKEFASQTPFRRPIAHGLFGLSLVAGLSSTQPAVDTVAFLGVTNWQFLHPIFFGDRVHVVTEVVDLTPHGRKRGKVSWKRTLLNQDGRITQQGHLQTIVACRDSVRRPAKVAKCAVEDVVEERVADRLKAAS